jgi:hypothetical protein
MLCDRKTGSPPLVAGFDRDSLLDFATPDFSPGCPGNFLGPSLSYPRILPHLTASLVSSDLLQPPSSFAPARSGDGDDVEDPELLALPPPPKAQRQLTVALLLLVALTASAMVYALRGEAGYALTSRAEIDLGELHEVDTSKVDDNRFVSARGSLGGALAVRFERPFEGDTYRVAPVMGRRDLWVELRVPAGAEGARYVPPASFSGRLVRWGGSGLRHRGLEGAVSSLTGGAIPADARLLVDGESPDGARWALALAALFAAFAVWCLVTMGRLVRRVA